MPYQYDLSPSQRIYLDNPGELTAITLTSVGPGQQQQATTQLSTGPWLEIPQVAPTATGLLLRCVTARGTFVWSLQGTQVAAVSPALWPQGQGRALGASPGAQSGVPMQPMRPMQPMEPTAPLTMGSMEMSPGAMSMRMGDMELRMGETAGAKDGQRRFCPQCGSAVTPSDRFCSSCGHQLHR